MNFLKRKYTLGEEIFNAVTHGIGALLSIAGCVILVVFCAVDKGAIEVVTVSVYGGSLILAYIMSTLYHAIQHEGAKKVLRIMDHNTIFVLIAGTYTPMTLCVLGGALGWVIFGMVWAAAIAGIVFSSVNLRKFGKISTLCYLIMGWGIIFAIKPLLDKMPVISFILLFAGGIIYSVGVIFYIRKEQWYMHSIWHIFVVLGSAAHYFSIMSALI